MIDPANILRIGKEVDEVRAELAAEREKVQRLQFALADTEALELGTAEQLAAAQATIEQMRKAHKNVVREANLRDVLPIAMISHEALSIQCTLNLLHELRALECERLAEVCLLDVDEPPNTGHEPKWLFSDGRSACVDRLREEAAAHRAKKEGK